MISILPENAIAQLRQRFGASLKTLRPEEVQILVMALEEGAVTNLLLQVGQDTNLLQFRGLQKNRTFLSGQQLEQPRKIKKEAWKLFKKNHLSL